MIIQIRGTSGSGKTTVMRAVMKKLEDLHPYTTPGRKKPLYYRTPLEVNEQGCGNVAVLGHYEDAACGGCDTIGSAPKIFELIKELEASEIPPAFILCEGLLLSEDVKWTQQMSEVRCLFLTTPLARCLDRIGARREAAGNEKPLNPSNTTKRVDVIERARTKLIALGVDCRRCSSEQAPSLVLRMLGIK